MSTNPHTVDASEPPEGYSHTSINYVHTLDAPDAETVSIDVWCTPTGLRTAEQETIDISSSSAPNSER